jgi:hypothetical protein
MAALSAAPPPKTLTGDTRTRRCSAAKRGSTWVRTRPMMTCWSSARCVAGTRRTKSEAWLLPRPLGSPGGEPVVATVRLHAWEGAHLAGDALGDELRLREGGALRGADDHVEARLVVEREEVLLHGLHRGGWSRGRPPPSRGRRPSGAHDEGQRAEVVRPRSRRRCPWPVAVRAVGVRQRQHARCARTTGGSPYSSARLRRRVGELRVGVLLGLGHPFVPLEHVLREVLGLGLSHRAESIGVRVKDTSSDTPMAKLMVKPKDAMKRPTMPPMKATGRNTAMSDSVVASTARPISAWPAPPRAAA